VKRVVESNIGGGKGEEKHCGTKLLGMSHIGKETLRNPSGESEEGRGKC